MTPTQGNREEIAKTERELITMERMYGKLREHAEALAESASNAKQVLTDNGWDWHAPSVEMIDSAIESFRKDFPATTQPPPASLLEHHNL